MASQQLRELIAYSRLRHTCGNENCAYAGCKETDSGGEVSNH
ncbi:MAG: hypothetical protein ACI8TQ_002942 [Planctomycetota bacterium]